MKVSILSSHTNVGGAAKAAFRLYNGLTNQGVEANFLARDTELKNIPGVFIINRSAEDVYVERSVQKHCINENRTNVSNTFFSFNYGQLGSPLIDLCKNYDIINLHWVDGFVSNDDLAAIVNLNKPIVWTLHDQKPFTGGCHYSAGCEEYFATCATCHMLQKNIFHLPERVLKHKIDILKNADLTIVSPSKWLAGEAKKSTLFSGSRVEVIPNSVDINVFQQLNKSKSKKELGINPDSIVLQFGAQNGKATRKGFSSLLKAIKLALLHTEFREKCERGEVVVLCLGRPDEKVTELPVKHKVLGYVSDEKEMSVAYSATDIFVLPSLEDNLPNTILESMACGTHVIGFDTGGFSDIVDESNGQVVEHGNCEHLSSAIINAVTSKSRRIAKNSKCRSIIENRYTLKHQADLYRNLFYDLTINKKDAVQEHSMTSGDSYYDIVGFTLIRDKVVSKMFSNARFAEKYVGKTNDCLDEKDTLNHGKIEWTDGLNKKNKLSTRLRTLLRVDRLFKKYFMRNNFF